MPDVHHDLPSIGRKAWTKIRPRGHVGQRLGVALPVHPFHRVLPGETDAAGDIQERARGGHGELSSAGFVSAVPGVDTVHDVLDQRNSRTGQPPGSDIERRRGQRAGFHVNEMARVYVPRIGRALNQDTPLAAFERLDDEVRRVPVV